MDEQKIEQQQYGAVNVQVPKEEWIKPKSDKVVLYHLKKEKSERIISFLKKFVLQRCLKKAPFSIFIFIKSFSSVPYS